MLSWLQGAGSGLLKYTVGDMLRKTAGKYPQHLALTSCH
jgi:hypothetical protein